MSANIYAARTQGGDREPTPGLDQALLLGRRSGQLEVYGKRNKHRTVPLNSTARGVLEEYLATLPEEAPCLFPSQKGEKAKDAEGKTLAPLSELAQIMGHDSLDTTMIYVKGTKQDLQSAVEEIAWR